ncbi:hypothetical protein BV25DRAFT_1895833 [Artomyces pyxidatus]|uniref:Uncharacterized protein n=1 Tax=Artomyces pyxidatus TaxID=48021 RepID=A0ACB8TJP6_9AGAM|nr:hypothetical protein BV25DRAFT_1895833 [Artomyces pyxidatus]
MAHTVYWPKTFLYAVGNTVPVCLTQDIPPEQSASILLLGCGDPRNILFTLHTSGVDTAALPRNLDFTCCDIEPAILARNVLLLSLIVDGDSPSGHLWNLFYDFFIKKPVLDLLSKQCRKLSDLAKDLDTWNSSEYAHFLRFCTRRTLEELRRHWTLYASFHDLPPARKTKVRDAFMKGMNVVLGKGTVVSGARSAGPLFAEALEVTPELFAHFWRTGINSLDSSDQKEATLLNPLFVYSTNGEGFSVHHGTHALCAFPLAAAFAETKDLPNNKIKSKKPSFLVQCAQDIFEEWCNSFKAVVQKKKSKLVIRFALGEALSICRALHYCASSSSTSSSVYTSAWQNSRWEFDTGDHDADATFRAPVTFDVIDSSNLADSLGLLNLLVVTMPILSRKASSVIMTETLLSAGSDALTGFVNQVGGDLTLMSLLLDLTPSTFVSKFSTYSNIHEILLYRALKQAAPFHERTSWKILSLADSQASRDTSGLVLPISFQPPELAKCLFHVYHKMFADESMDALRQTSSLEMLSRTSLVNYVRASYAFLLHFVKERTKTDWDSVMDNLFDFWHQDTELIFGSNYYQDLCAQLHISDTFTVETMRPAFPRSTKGSILRGWGTLPPVVCVTLVVPRNSLKKLENLGADKLGTPVLQCEIEGPGYRNFFPSIQAVFGNLTSSGSNDATRLTLEEVRDGWSATAPLVMSFWVPSWMFSAQPSESMRVNFMVRASTTNSFLFMSVLGQDLTIFGALVTDSQHVYITRERPSNPGEIEKIKAGSFKQSEAPAAPVVSATLDPECKKISTFSAKVDIVKEDEREVLLSGAAVAYEQVSPSGIEFTFGPCAHKVFFPFPVDGTRIKLRIARKTHFIEVVVPPSGPLTPGGFYLNPYPLIFEGTTPTLWNIHRLNLDRLPALDPTAKSQLSWLNPHVSFMLSDRERSSVSGAQLKQQSVQQTLVDVKESLHSIFIRFTGLQGDGAHTVFALAEPSSGPYMLLFVSALRLDAAANTLALDAYAFPLTNALRERAMGLLERLVARAAPPVQVNTVDNEMRAWLRLLPALAERCRIGWVHGAECEYLRPRGDAEGGLCGCGRGRGGGAPFKVGAAWAELAPLVTRVALGPLFAVSYLDTVAGNLDGPVPPVSSGGNGCALCGKEGRPRLLLCSRCKRVSYCSAECQKADWKIKHKVQCSP